MPVNKISLQKFWANIPILMSVLSVATLLIGAYITIRLVPLYQTISNLDGRVLAVEERNKNVDPLVPRFIVVEEKVNNIEELLVKIDNTLIRLENKIDRLN